MYTPIKNNKMLANIFQDIDYIKKAMYLYAFLENNCNNDYAEPINLLSEYNIISCSSFNMIRKQLDHMMLALNEMITDQRQQLNDDNKNLLRQNGVNSKTLTWEILDRLDWSVYGPDSNLPREYHEVAVPIVLKHLIHVIIELLDCKTGAFIVTNVALAINIFVESKEIADSLATIIPNVAVYHNERLLYRTGNTFNQLPTSNDAETFDIILIEKPCTTGLTKVEILKLCNYFENEIYPIEIEAKRAECSAMGFITNEAADSLDFDYAASGLNDFVALILDDMNNESETEAYIFRGLKIKLIRNI